MPGIRSQRSILELPNGLATAQAENSPLEAQASQLEIPVPLLDFNRQYKPIRDEVLAAVARVCDSQQFILGPEVDALEAEIASLTGARAAVGCASGTDALWLALVGAGVKPGDQVITTPFSFFASASSIVRVGAEPIFVDVDPATLNLDGDDVRRELKKKSKRGAGKRRARDSRRAGARKASHRSKTS